MRSGRRRADDRRTLDAILYVLRAGGRWRDLRPRWGSSITCRLRLDRWIADRTWERIRRCFLGELAAEARRERRCAFREGSFVRARKGAVRPGARRLASMQRGRYA